MRTIKKIIIHCTATPSGREVTLSEVDRWHRERGFAGIGYHFLIVLQGEIWAGRALSKAGAHTKGHNSDSIGVCYVGGCDHNMLPIDTRTTAQVSALKKLIFELQQKFPDARVYGHNEFAAKACPCFDVKKEYRK